MDLFMFFTTTKTVYKWNGRALEILTQAVMQLTIRTTGPVLSNVLIIK